MELNEVRKKYLEFFEKRGHKIIPSASLVPENDPTTLFTGSGMQPLVPYLLGKNHPAGARLADSQKCFRSMDIEEVGDNRHTTFFEMLGNWSLGDYWKEEQLKWFFEFLTGEVGIKKEKLWVTCFEGDDSLGLPRDNESARIWQELGIAEERIIFYPAKKNWWSRSGEPKMMPVGEPGGPDSEVFYRFENVAHDKKFGETCHPNCDCGRFVEIGNSVFMEYIKNPDGSFGKLPKRNVDFGGGLERITAASNDSPDIFQIDIFKRGIEAVENFSKKSYGDEAYKKSFRIILDHVRAAVFLAADGIRPGPNERGYLLRRLIRRAALEAERIGLAKGVAEQSELEVVAKPFIAGYQSAYPDEFGAEKSEQILGALRREESQFRKTLGEGVREFEKGVDAFTLFTTYGFPFELTKELSLEKGVAIDEKEFQKKMLEHQELSRAGSEQKFKGGLADTAEETVRLHTAHHLLLRALQLVLGPEVHQRGSNITRERLRMDFSFGRKLTDEEKKEVERIVNEKIADGLPVIRSEMSRDEALRLGAEHEFGQKYPDRVSVYSVGPKGATLENPKFDQRFSIEFCGGPHVSNTSELGRFKILKEEAVAGGIRRIKAVLV